jgi:hypothetical protein
MECSIIFLIAERRNAKAAAILVVNTLQSQATLKVAPEGLYELNEGVDVQRSLAISIRIALESLAHLTRTN